MIGTKLIRFLVEMAEDFFLRAKHRHEDADRAAAAGKELQAKSAEVFDLALFRRAAAAKADARGRDVAQHEIEKIRRDNAGVSEALGNQSEAKAVAIDTEMQREKAETSLADPARRGTGP